MHSLGVISAISQKQQSAREKQCRAHPSHTSLSSPTKCLSLEPFSRASRAVLGPEKPAAWLLPFLFSVRDAKPTPAFLSINPAHL